MTKLIKRITIVAVVLMALIGTGGVVAFASGYITWGGTDNYNKAMDNLDLIRKKGQIVVDDLDDAKAAILVLDSDNKAKQKEIDELEETVTQKNQVIDDRDATIASNEKTIDNLTKQVNEGNAFMDQLTTEVTKYVKEVNQVNGKGPRYDKIASIVNENGHFIGVTDKLDTNPAGGPTSNQLDQAIKDMKNVNNETENVLDIFKDVELEDEK